LFCERQRNVGKSSREIMSNLKVSLVQTQQFWEDKQANYGHLDQVLSQVGETDLIVLPEMFNTGFSMKPALFAEEMSNSEALAWLKVNAINKDCAIYTSFMVKENNHFFNRGIFMLPSGEYYQYDKRQLFSLAGEDDVFSAGNEKVVIAYKGWNILLQICYDLRFPEIQRNKLDSSLKPDYDLLLTVANWPKSRSSHWKTLLIARAIENQCYVVGVNRVGTDGKGLVYSGDSVAIDALGNIEGCEEGAEKIISTLLSKKKLTTIRNLIPFLKDIGLD
jgi:omega-amidase